MFFIAIAAISILSCNKSNKLVNAIPQTHTHTRSSLPTPITDIGREHNTFLADVYDSIINDEYADFEKQIGYVKSRLEPYHNVPSYSQCLTVLAACSTKAAAKNQVEILRYNIPADSFAYATIGNIQALMDSSTSVDNFNELLGDYYSAYKPNDTSVNVVKFKNLCGVAYGSYTYWTDNIDAWDDLRGSHKTRMTKKEKVIGFALSDLLGVGGGVPLMVIASGLWALGWD